MQTKLGNAYALSDNPIYDAMPFTGVSHWRYRRMFYVVATRVIHLHQRPSDRDGW